MRAGRKQGRNMDMAAITRLLEKSSPEDAQFIAEDILSRALLLDGHQPNDHMMAICVGVSDKESDNKVQRRTANFPL